MASIIYNSFLDDLAKGNVDLDSDTFYAMLVTSGYTADKDTHTKRSDVTNEVAAGSGYATGGAATALTLTKDTTNDREDVAIGDVTWASASFTARGAVVYKHRGGLASADELVCFIDFTTDQTGGGGNFTLHTTSPLRFQN